MMRRGSGILLAGLLWAGGAAAAENRDMAAQAEQYLQPYIQTHNFSGAVLITRAGENIFHEAYGQANKESGSPNRTDSRFHIASMSMQFTAAAIMRLIEKGALSLDTHVAEIVNGVPNGDKITIRNLLEETSGLPDANELPAYPDVLQHHQTPESLVGLVRGLPPASEPGSFKREEHSAYNLLALILEIKTKLPFAIAMQREVFGPLEMHDSGVDDDSTIAEMSVGYEPDGTFDIRKAQSILWSAKAGNGSAFSTVWDESRWLEAFFSDGYLSGRSRERMLDYKAGRVGYGWFKNESKRFQEPIYYMNGRAPGFSSCIIYLPREKIGVVVLSNIYISVTTQIGFDLAALAVGLPSEKASIRTDRLSEREAEKFKGRFKFGADFYQPNATISLSTRDREAFLTWADGSISPLIPVDATHFIDRNYWEPVSVVYDAAGNVSGLHYDRFEGARTF